MKNKKISNTELKKRIFHWLITSKIIVFSALFFYTSTEGYHWSEFFSIAALLLPLFTVYLSIIFDSYLSPTSATEPQTEISPELANMYKYLFPVYTIAIIFVLYQGAVDAQTDLKVGIGLVESGLGVYIGRIVVALFKKS